MQTITFKYDHMSNVQYGPNRAKIKGLYLNEFGVKQYWLEFFDTNGRVQAIWATEDEVSEIK